MRPTEHPYYMLCYVFFHSMLTCEENPSLQENKILGLYDV